jgi:hypothetical protein
MSQNNDIDNVIDRAVRELDLEAKVKVADWGSSVLPARQR